MAIYIAGQGSVSAPPDQLNAEGFAKIVQKYLSDHPARLREKAQLLVFDALKAAFPRK